MAAPKLTGYRIFTATGYGGYVELGTTKQVAQPFIAPAVQQAIQEFNRRGPWQKNAPKK